jgi:hypothetical protein
VSLPRRVFIPLTPDGALPSDGGFIACDYLSPGELVEVSQPPVGVVCFCFVVCAELGNPHTFLTSCVHVPFYIA